jgi:Fe-S cluster assembly iron-binding protein IscA
MNRTIPHKSSTKLSRPKINTNQKKTIQTSKKEQNFKNSKKSTQQSFPLDFSTPLSSSSSLSSLHFTSTPLMTKSSTRLSPLNSQIHSSLSKRFFAINLVNSKTSPSPPPPPKTDTKKSSSFSESELSEEDEPEIEKPPLTVDDFIILPSAINHLKYLNKDITDQNQRVGLRITVDTGGCSGFQYIYTKETAPPLTKIPDFYKALSSQIEFEKPSDILGSAGGQVMVNFADEKYFLKEKQFVVSDNVSLDFLRNSQLEYKSELIRSGFAIVNNPNVDLACGCGTSFSKKNAV